MEFFSVDYSADDLVASVATGVQTTFASLGPIVAVVVGLVLTFILAPKVISLFKHAGRSRSN